MQLAQGSGFVQKLHVFRSKNVCWKCASSYFRKSFEKALRRAGVDFQKFEDFELARRRRRFFKIQNFETLSWPAAGVDFQKLDLGDFELARRRRQFF